MTFAESEYPEILAEIDRLLSGPNPLEGIARVRELIRIHDRIPLYPGLVGVVGNAVAEERAAEELSRGDKVAWREGRRFYLGVVKEVGRGGAVVERVLAGAPVGAKKIRRKTVTVIRGDALKRAWPALYFPPKKRRKK